MAKSNKPGPPSAKLPLSSLPMIVYSKELLAGRDEICIVHNGERYRLRVTRRGKLILQK